MGSKKSIDCLEGMFAMDMDRDSRCLSLARDFAGIKPLYYGSNSKGFVFLVSIIR